MRDDAPAGVRDLREAIGRVGVWTFALDRTDAGRSREFAAEVEELGYGALWFPESVRSKEAFSHAGLLLAATRRLVVATGIASVWARDPVAMANGARNLADAHPGRFVLGLGVSHAPSVARRGHEYSRPVATMRAYLDAMDEAAYDGPAVSDPPRVLAALGPRMLALARERAAGAHPYFVPVDHTGRARRALGPEPVLAVEQAVALTDDAEHARATAREHMRRYLTLDNYARNLRRLGWAQGDLDGGGSDELVDALVAWGGIEEVRARVADHHARGADHVCLQVLGTEPGDLALPQLRSLAPALLDAAGNGPETRA